MKNRGLALVAAVAMVVVAVQVRARLDDREVDRRPRIVCANEVAVVCVLIQDDADVDIEPAGVTADRLLAAGNDLGLDGWITPGPWAEMVRRSREQASKSGGLTVAAPVARSRLAFAVWPERLDGLRSTCGGDVGWQCLVQASAAPTFKLGFPDPRRDALGLVALGSAAQALAPDNPLDDDVLHGALDTLARAVPQPLPPFLTVLAGGPSLVDVYATVEVGGSRRMTLTYPAPVVTADVVPAYGVGERGRRAADLLRARRVADTLQGTGWDAASGRTPSGLPDVGVLEALRNLWAEVAR